MFWLSHQNSADEGIKPDNNSRKQHIKRSTDTVVEFIPAQIDSLCGTSPAHHKQTVSKLLLNDLQLLGQNIYCLPAMMRASSSTKLLRSSFRSPGKARDTILQGLLAIAQSWMLAIAIPTLLLLPGFLHVTMFGLCWIFTLAITWPLSGPRVVMSSQVSVPTTEDFSDELWIYVNGMMCSHRSLRSQCDLISSHFGRPVIGVHNRTSGFVLDLLTCLAQRCLNFATPCTLTLGSQLRDACLMNSVRKVVVLSHSTGAIHVSIALDRLHATLPIEVLSKLEIYTFGSAASHLNNPFLRINSLLDKNERAGSLSYTRPDSSIASPVKATLASLGHMVEDHEHVISHVEHYALASDFFARIGILHNTRNVLDNRLCGRIFIIDDRAMSKLGQGKSGGHGGGFLLSEHYLDLLFPDKMSIAKSILDQVVEVDDQTAEKREFTAQGVASPQKSLNECHNSGRTIDQIPSNQSKSATISPKSLAPLFNVQNSRRKSWETASALGIGGVAKARDGVRESEGKTVRQLSRLWRYAHGGRPIGEGVAVMNGVGHGLGMKNTNGSGVGGTVNYT